MRPVPAFAAILVLAALPAATTRAVLASAASTLLESMPFILAGSGLMWAWGRRGARAVPYLGCGCGAGPSARSLPAAVATWITFGAPVAIARVIAAMCVERAFRSTHWCASAESSPLEQLATLAPVAAASAAVLTLTRSFLHPGAMPHAAAFALGAAIGTGAAPCAIGAVGVAAALRGAAPLAAWGFLCTAGIADVRAFAHRHGSAAAHDGLAYALAALACGFVAWRGGDALVHPHFTQALWVCAAALAILAWRNRNARAPRAWLAPAIMLCGALAGAPLPAYHATETTLADAFAGERIDFTGELTRTGNVASIVRYAITCCRADAMPVVLRVTVAPSRVRGWVRARGSLVATPDGLELRVERFDATAPPADPFVYR